MADEPIVKLVFLRQQAAQAGSRKAVVPLVEGADFDQFLLRVRRRLNIPSDATATLRDVDGLVVDSIDRLLELDESSTLTVVADVAAGVKSAPGLAQTPSRRSIGGAAGGAGSCRVDIPATEWARSMRDHEAVEDESGTLKYRKRRGSGRARGIACVACLAGVVVLRLVFQT